MSKEKTFAAPSSSTNQRVPSRFLLGLIFLAASLAASIMLVVQHLGHLQLPGCGPNSGCETLAEGRWGSLLSWPISYLGTAYFLSLTVVWLWIGLRPALSGLFKWGVRFGMLGSIFFTILMFVEGHFCPYCIAVHSGNMLFWIVVECSRREPKSPFFVPSMIGAMVFFAQLIVLNNIDIQAKDTAAEAQEAKFQTSLSNLLVELPKYDRPVPEDTTAPLQGRWQAGEKVSPIRLVVFSDYGCKDCWEMEEQLEEALEGRDDVSYTHLHYPLCAQCNPSIKWKEMHPNSCRAAWAAEVAGMLGGDDGFWRLHRWLFKQKGEWTDEQLVTVLPELGFEDTDAFLAAMDDPKIKEAVTANLKVGKSLAIPGTPCVFVNGRMLEGACTEHSIRRMLDSVAKLNLPARTADRDRPKHGMDRLLDRWRQAEVVAFPRHSEPGRTLGPVDASIRAVFWVDHQSPYTPEISRTIRRVLAEHEDVHLELLHFPINSEHNMKFEKLTKNIAPDTWPMSKAAEAAAKLKGQDAFWKMHDWLLDHQDSFTIDGVLDAAVEIGIDRDQFTQTMESEKVASSLANDIKIGNDLKVGFPPCLFINGQTINVYSYELEQLLRNVLDEAAGQ